MLTSWRKYAAESYKIEKRYLTLIQRALKKYVKFFVNDLRSQGIQQATASLSLSTLNDDLYPVIHSLYKTAGLQGARREYTSLTAQAKEGKKYSAMGRNEAWQRAVLEYLRLHLLNKAVLPISETTRDNILKVISEGVKEGWSVDEMAKRLESNEFTLWQAQRITRTEINKASNVGHSIGAKSFPYLVNKKWVAAKDHRTRHSHRDVANHVTDEDGKFKVERWKGEKMVGHDYMRFPGDPEASPENVINCRCRITHIPKTDKNGRLIPRTSQTQQAVPRSAATTLIASSLLSSTLATLFQEASSD